ncbi:hypothetical protein D6810_02025 [Candidatus Dojkabacteria bacterium]|uniref:DNA-(apurinic or apyrimidinic site) lyase n=1 Tax=Candidatus Dojkabacteria bacterium TaxID=2099670 RepID=A0A3M0Z050_9BACT|nr:MAG: hypothetical protein D6810_02025 [Candidatus Dojkabacteria bacterium]
MTQWNKIELEHNINLESSIEGGQIFNWFKIADFYIILFSDWAIKIKSKNNFLFWQSYPKKDNIEKAVKFLNLEVLSTLEKYKSDMNIKKAIGAIGKLLLFRQNYEQATISFILSARQNIKNIRKQSLKLSSEYGAKIKIDENKFFLFPKIEVLAKQNETSLRNLKIGYKSSYIIHAAKMIHENCDNFKNLSLENKYCFIKTLKGVGNKIADCVSVFSLGDYSKVPIDVWAKRAIIKLYGAKEQQSYSYYQSYYRKIFPVESAYPAQYIFEFFRRFNNEK